MQQLPLGASSLLASRIAYGCWRLAGDEHSLDSGSSQTQTGIKAVLTAADAGYTLFDLADIYGNGRCETIFGQALREKTELRSSLVVTTKCGIRRADDPAQGAPYRYDFDAEFIIRACEGSLSRMGIETIDLFQLHRPDYLMEPDEVARAFESLRSSGKAREFGVSNFRPSQFALLQKSCPMRLHVHQIEISLLQLTPLDDGTLDHCLAEGITPLAWSPLARGRLGGAGVGSSTTEKFPPKTQLVQELEAIGRHHGVHSPTIALAWLVRHPAKIIPIIGSTKPDRIREAVGAAALKLSREEWYRLMEAARGDRLP
jgi:predicted oxidoreductase